MNFPLDTKTFSETLSLIIEHQKAQDAVVQKMKGLLEEAMDEAASDSSSWYNDAETLIKDLKSLEVYHESRRFNEDNFRSQFGYEATPKAKAAASRLYDPTALPDFDSDMEIDEGGKEMSEEDLSKFFKERRKTKKHAEESKTLKQMSLEEIEDWEKKQDNSNDIYRIKARVANLARGPGMSLTPQGEILCNSFVHVLKSMYEFAEKITDPTVKIKLTELIKSHENFPNTVISAAGAGVRQEKGTPP